MEIVVVVVMANQEEINLQIEVVEVVMVANHLHMVHFNLMVVFFMIMTICQTMVIHVQLQHLIWVQQRP